jgi:hypothetical protein
LNAPQIELDELLRRFEQEHPELVRQMRSLPELPALWQSLHGQVVVQTGTATQPSGLAYLGSGTEAGR